MRMTARHTTSNNCKAQGFTLIEIVVGIVVLAIAMLVITNALGPIYQRSSDPWHQVRAAELGQSFLNEIMARSFDENSDRAGSGRRCDDANDVTSIACSVSVGTDSNESFTDAGRRALDDVDDFHGFSASGDELTGILGEELTGLYTGFTVNVEVGYDGNRDGLLNDNVAGCAAGCLEKQAKRIAVAVATPSGEVIWFSAYRGNW